MEWFGLTDDLDGKGVAQMGFVDDGLIERWREVLASYTKDAGLLGQLGWEGKPRNCS